MHLSMSRFIPSLVLVAGLLTLTPSARSADDTIDNKEVMNDAVTRIQVLAIEYPPFTS